MTYGFPGSDFSEIRWEIFARTRRHVYSCIMHGRTLYSCNCDAGDIRGKYLGDLILLA